MEALTPVSADDLPPIAELVASLRQVEAIFATALGSAPDGQ
jgi:hypothetical protein